MKSLFVKMKSNFKKDYFFKQKKAIYLIRVKKSLWMGTFSIIKIKAFKIKEDRVGILIIYEFIFFFFF
jgi:hypothetical protein